jgi:hypothetical protein
VSDNISAIPFEVFDEWYIFTDDSPERDYKVFVKHDWFTLGPAQTIYSRTGNAFDLKRMQRWFWQELEEAKPESYLGRGSRLKFVSKNPEYFNTVLRGLSSLARIRAKSAKAPA